MKLEYAKRKADDTSTYKEWAEALWSHGFTMPAIDTIELLGVSLSWINHNLLKSIDYVVYDSKWLYAKTSRTSQTYIRMSDLTRFIQENATFMVQTEVIDLAYHLKPYRKVYMNADKLYEKEKETYKNRGFIVGTMPKKVLDYINEELIIENAYRNFSCKQRSRVPWVELEPFDIFERKDRIYYVGDKNHPKEVSEKIYRNAFLHGDVRIKLGGIVIFYEARQNIEGMKLPYLIPYGKSVRVIEKR